MLRLATAALAFVLFSSILLTDALAWDARTLLCTDDHGTTTIHEVSGSELVPDGEISTKRRTSATAICSGSGATPWQPT